MNHDDPENATNPDGASAPPEQVSFAGPPSAPRPERARRAGRAVAWVAVGAIGATVLTGIALASGNESGQPSASPEATSGSESGDATRTGPGGAGRGGPGHGGPGHGLLARGEAVLHGELVVKDGDGTRTVLTQNGTITAASATSLTVKSTDDFTATWTLDDDTKVRAFAAKGEASTVSDLKVGDEVMVAGTKATSTSGTATLVHVRPTAAQLEELRESMPKWRGRSDEAPGRNEPSATPSATASSSGA